MVSRSELEAALASAHDPPERTLCLAAYLTRALTGPQPVVLVGGSAMEVYSAGLYVSADVDIVGDRTAAAKILESWGFAREGLIWWQPEWKVTIDLVGGPYTWSFERTRLMQT